MSSVDFKQEAKHHGFIHIIVKDLGEESGSFFSSVFKVLTELPPIQLVEPKGTVLFLRFLSSYDLPPWALGGPKWSDFCAHKQVLGVLGVCKCCDLDDLSNVLAGYKNYSEKFKNTNNLCQLRCIIYGSKEELEGGGVDSTKGHCLIDCNVASKSAGNVGLNALTEIIDHFAVCIYKALVDEIAELEKNLEVGSSPVKFLRSPFESKDTSRPDDDDARSISTQSKGRMEKHIADLSLLAGDHWKAFMLYKRAKQSFSKLAQNIWYAAINEGLAVTRIIINLCEEVLGQKAQGLVPQNTRTPFLKTGSTRSLSRPTVSGSSLSPRPSLAHDNRHSPLSNSDLARISKHGTIRRVTSNAAEGDMEKPNGGVVFKVSHLDHVKRDSVSSGGAGSDEEGSGVEDGEEDDDEDLDGESTLQVDQVMLRKDFIVDKYRDALKAYNKAKLHEAVAHLEALLKFSKYLVDQKRYLMASDQLQKMMRIDDTSSITDLDKLQLYCTIAEMNRSMGFHRKAALFTHYAARWASTIAQSPDQVSQAFDLISRCLSGYKLSQQFSELLNKEASSSGWPQLQAQVLKDLVFLSRKKEHDELAISHSCYLLQCLVKYLSAGEIQDVISMLGEIAKEKAQNSLPSPPTVNGALSSPLPLENFPSIKSVCLIELVDLLKPIKIEGFVSPAPKETEASSSNSPFIFSPFEAKRRKGKQRPEVLWVVGTPGEVLMSVENILPFELRVTNMLVHVVAEGTEVVTYPASLTLPSRSEPQDIKLLTVPSEPGFIDIKGYEATVFGVRYECKVKIPGDPIVRVVPPLPEIRLRLYPSLSSSLQDSQLSPTLRVNKASITELELRDGETFNCEFHIDCLSKGELAVDVEQITLTVADYNKDYCDISWEDSTIKALLPLAKGHSGSFIVSIRGKIPAWFRVLNEHTQGYSKTTVFPEFKQDPALSSIGSAAHHSYSANTTPTESPTSSPVPKRSSLVKKNKRGSDRSSDSEYSYRKESSLMDSLNLDHPALVSTRNSSTLPRDFHKRSPGHQRNTSVGSGGKWKNRGSKKGDDFDWDLNKRFSMVSTRSDPGDEFRNKSTKTKSVEQTKSVPIPKSEARSSPYSHSPQLYDPGSHAPSVVSSIVSRTSLGNKGVLQRKQQTVVLSKGHISTPMGPLIRQKPQASPRTEVTGEFSVQYTGGQGYLEGFCRKCSAKLTIMVKPCLVFEKFEVLSDQVFRDNFNLKFSVHNITKSRIEAIVHVDQELNAKIDEGTISVTLDPNGLKEVVVPIKRFALPVSDQESQDSSTLSKSYSERVGEIVKVHWKDLEKNKMGVVSLNGLHLPVSTLPLVMPIPLLFGSSINDLPDSFQLSHNRECSLGERVKLAVRLTNTSGVSMPSSFLHFDPNLHLQQQKRMLKDLKGVLLHTGSLLVNVPQLEPNKSFEHELTLVFLLNGTYYVEVKSYVQLEGTPTFQVKIPSTTTKTVSESTATTKSTSDPTEQALSQMCSQSQSFEIDGPGSSTSLSPMYDQSRPFSPPSVSSLVSPRRSPGLRKNFTSDLPDSKALKMAKQYEARVAARDATVYKESLLASKRTLSIDSNMSKSPSIEKLGPDFVEQTDCKDVKTDSKDELTNSESSKVTSSNSICNISSEATDNGTVAVFPAVKQPESTKIDYIGISTLLSEFVPPDSLPRSATASPVQMADPKHPTPPPLPRGYHGTLTSTNISTEKQSKNSERDCFSRFHKLLSLRTENPKAVRLVSGPRFVFSVS